MLPRAIAERRLPRLELQPAPAQAEQLPDAVGGQERREQEVEGQPPAVVDETGRQELEPGHRRDDRDGQDDRRPVAADHGHQEAYRGREQITTDSPAVRQDVRPEASHPRVAH